MRPLLRLSSLVLLGLLLRQAGAAPSAAAPSAAKPRETSRFGIYLQSQRVGGMVLKRFDTVHGMKPAVRMDVDTAIRLTALGMPVEQNVRMSHTLTPEGRPRHSRISISSAGRTTTIDARYEPKRVVCSVDAGGQKSTRVVPIPAGVTLVGDPDVEKGAGELKVGKKSVLHFFEPLTMTIQKMESEVVKSEVRQVKGRPARVFQIRSKNTFAGESTSWVDARGRVLEDRTSVGLRIVSEDLGARPPVLAYEPPRDFVVATSVRTEGTLTTPRAVRSLGLKISGIPDTDLILPDARQRVEERQQTAAGITAVYRVTARDLPTSALPAAAPGAVGPGLGDAPYLGVNDPGIRAQAKELAGGEKDRALLARRIRAWVHGHMEKQTSVGTPRSAAEIMRTRAGVCRDYATLFTAVARAAGVPTRVCGGIVYFNDAFFYHAWVECLLQDGEDGWYAFDPTLADDFVDATHVKFAQGDPAEMFSVARVVGQIRAEILEHR